MSRPPLTATGAERLKTELNRLKTVERPRIVQAIAEAREQQGFCEGRIQELESVLSNAQVIDIATVGAANPGKVVFGATVELEELKSGDTITYQIVGDAEADLKLGMIAVSSPVARALIGKEEGDVAVVQAPGGVREYEILEVRYA